MATLVFMFLVLCVLCILLIISDTIASILNTKVFAGGIIGYLIAKYFQKDGDK